MDCEGGLEKAEYRQYTDEILSNRKRLLSPADGDISVDTSESEPLDNIIERSKTPEGIHPVMWAMLKKIDKNTALANSKIDNIDHRVLVLEDQADHTGTEIAQIKAKMDSLVEENKIIMGRLIRAESKINRQQSEIIDLRARSMRDNVIVKTKGDTYKERKGEDTASVFRNFVSSEMCVPDANKIDITRAHRMGKASADKKRIIIAKVTYNEDQKRIFDNAKVLKNTEYFISKQIPGEMEDRKQFGWKEFQKAKGQQKPVRFEGGRLMVVNEFVTAFDPEPLPSLSKPPGGSASAPLPPVSLFAGDHFQCWAAPLNSLQGVRNAYDGNQKKLLLLIMWL